MKFQDPQLRMCIKTKLSNKKWKRQNKKRTKDINKFFWLVTSVPLYLKSIAVQQTSKENRNVVLFCNADKSWGIIMIIKIGIKLLL